MKSPFKFLSPFQQEDIDSFFGREQETDMLYEFVNLNRVVLVYGQSGTGKTSLIQCGLSNYFKSTDWKPFFIRRVHNINATLLEVISEPGSAPVEASVYQEKEVYLQLITQRIEALKAKYLRPVYLIFDQFEELLILGAEKEKEIFIETLKAILHGEGKLSCNIIIVMREEYFAWLDVFEKEIPGISDRRLRVEKMRPVELREVIRRSTALFNIRLEDEEKNIEQILQALSKRKDVPLPYLQVYLDQLWRKDFAKSYPVGYTGNEKYPPLTFTTREIEEFGEIKDVLQQLIIECEEEIMHGLKEMNAGIENNFVRRVLDVFASEEGTKLTVPYFLENGQFRFRAPAKALNSMPYKAVEYTLNTLEKSNILKNDGHSFELAHDSLAKLIDRQRDAKQKWLNGIRLVIENAYKVYEQTNELMSAELVKEYESHITQLNLKDREKRFFLKSQVVAKKEEYSELIRARRRKNMKIITLALAILLIALVTAAVRLINAADKYYALVYAAYDLDSIKNNNNAMLLGKYIYDYRDGDNYDSLTKSRLEKKMLKLASNPEFQKQFSFFNFKLPSSRGLEPGDAGISESGRYMLIKGVNPENGDTMHILVDIQTRHAIDTFKGLSYAYFIQHTDTLLLAKSASAEPIAASYPNKYSFYNCQSTDNKETFVVPPGNSLLYSRENVFDPIFSDRDNYKVRILSNGNFLFPVITKDGRGKLYVMKDNRSREYNSIYSVSNSTDGNSYMLADSKGYDPTIKAYNQDGVLEWEKDAIFMADFTEKGSIIYISSDSLHLYNTNAEGVRSYKLQPKISYAIADGDESVALVRSSQDTTFFLADLASGKFRQFTSDLVGYNFQARQFITRKYEDREDKITLYDFQGNIVQSYVCREGIKSQLYNPATSQLYLLTNAYNFIVLDSRLKQKASFYLTANDTYGCSADGSIFYYVRDDNVCLFRNDNSFLNLHDYPSISGWLDTCKAMKIRKDTVNALRDSHGLRFPSQRYFFWF